MSCLILEVSPKSAEAVRVEVLPRALELSTSPLLQGLALASLLNLFKVPPFSIFYFFQDTA